MALRARAVRKAAERSAKTAVGKKAMFFTLISIMIIIMFIFYFKMQIDIPMKQKTVVVKERVTSLNDFVRSFEEVYLPRALYALSHRAIGSMSLYLNSTTSLPIEQRFSRNISADFFSAVVNGTTADRSPLLGMEGNTMLDWLNKLTNVSRREMNIELNYTINGISLEQDYGTGPWGARASMEISYWIASQGLANWTRNNTVINVTFDVSGFMDPYLAVMSNGTINRPVNLTNLTTDRINDLDQFKALVNGGAYFFENKTAPGFLQRFEGNTSNSSCCGIESFVTPYQIYPTGAGDLDIYGSSYIDFEFWTGKCFNEESLQQETELWNATDIYSEFGFFKLDSYHRFKAYPNIFNESAGGYRDIKIFAGMCGQP